MPIVVMSWFNTTLVTNHL